MLEQTTLSEVVVKIRNREKQDFFTVDLTINELGQINLLEVCHKVNDIYSMDEGLMLYFDHSENTYTKLQIDQLSSIHQSSLINQNMINLRFEPKISDQLLANHEIKPEETRTKRSRERIISDVFLVVEQWRLLYLQGIQNEKGEREKVNLDQSATMLGIPRKSLQDYFLLLRNGVNRGFDFKLHFRSKVGVLRSFVREHKKQEKEKKDFKERVFLKNLRRELFGITAQEFENEIFGEDRHSGSSDEDLIFFQH